ELDFFVPWLLDEIRASEPRMIAVLGNTPLHALAGKNVMIGSVHGQMVPIRGTERSCFALYHPASLIYNPSLRDVYEADIRALAALVQANEAG
ncbi:MAG: uracil-DNA glycosylase, partial [Clostridia bacterium]|nr:uracil-DNA glycosylase [Clostridia bacterium]